MRAIRRTDRQLSVREAVAILDKAEFGVMSTVDNDGQPYGLPLSYVFRNGAVYFHCAVSGHKLDNLAENPRVSFCVVGKTRVLPDQFATEYESVVAFGVAEEIRGPERHDALVWLLEKYSPDFLDEGKRYIARKDAATKVVKIAISHFSGKARR